MGANEIVVQQAGVDQRQVSPLQAPDPHQKLAQHPIEPFMVVGVPPVTDVALPDVHRPRVRWDVQVNFMLNGLKYTVDLEMQERDGQVTNARLIDTMEPLQIFLKLNYFNI